LFLASDLPRLEAGVRLPRAGEYTLKVWAPRRLIWSSKRDENSLVLQSSVEGDDPRMGWQEVAKIQVEGEQPVLITVPNPEKGPRLVPAILSLSTDAAFQADAFVQVARGRVDSDAAPEDPRRSQVRTNQQGAGFRAPATALGWRDRARTVREQMLVTLGLWPMPPRTPLEPKIYGELKRDGYTIEKVVLETLPGFTLGGNLYRPAGKPGKLPAILCPHGHWADGRVNPEVQMRCIRWAKLGCIVFLYDMVGYNDSKPFGHAFLNDRLRRWGISLATLQTWNSIRALDWLTTLPEVDTARIGCTGESGGGTQTFLLTALDQRIKVAAPVVMVSDSFQGGCVCENAAGLRHGTDNVEFAALTAPRPLKLVGASGDWTAKTMSNAFPAIREVYALVGNPDRVSADVYEFPHNYNQTTRNAVYAFMAHWLLGIDDPERTKEGEQTPEKPEDLVVYDAEHPAPSGLKTPTELEADIVGTLARQIDQLAPRTNPVFWQADAAILETSLKTRVGLVNPPWASLVSREVRRSARDGLTIVHSLVSRAHSGEQIPVVRLIPAHPTGRSTVIFHRRGKAHLTASDGGLAPRVNALLARGHSVVGFDPFLIGESTEPSAYQERRPDAAHYHTYNASLPADRLQDLATVLAWTRAQPDTLEVSLLGEGECGPLALLARPALAGLARTAIDLDGFHYGDGSNPIPAALDLPGVLQFGALKAAAALVAPEPLRIMRPGERFEVSWPAAAYALADARQSLIIDDGQPEPEALARWIDTGE
jgi:hypothetical protein